MPHLGSCNINESKFSEHMRCPSQSISSKSQPPLPSSPVPHPSTPSVLACACPPAFLLPSCPVADAAAWPCAAGAGPGAPPGACADSGGWGEDEVGATCAGAGALAGTAAAAGAGPDVAAPAPGALLTISPSICACRAFTSAASCCAFAASAEFDVLVAWLPSRALRPATCAASWASFSLPSRISACRCKGCGTSWLRLVSRWNG